MNEEILQHSDESDHVGDDIKNHPLDDNQHNNATFIANHERNRGNPCEKEIKIRQSLCNQVTREIGQDETECTTCNKAKTNTISRSRNI